MAVMTAVARLEFFGDRQFGTPTFLAGSGASMDFVAVAVAASLGVVAVAAGLGVIAAVVAAIVVVGGGAQMGRHGLRQGSTRSLRW